MNDSIVSDLASYITENARIDWQGDIPTCSIPVFTRGMAANSYFFGHPKWGKEYFNNSHRSQAFRERWLAAMGSWDDKIVVDIGCGPGNVYATVGGSPKLLIGVDVSRGALEMAQSIGYKPILADAHHLPFVNGFADIVVANATIHHCDDMARILSEAARIVRPGGILFTDQDPQVSAWNFKGLGLFLRDIRFPLYWLMRYKHYIPDDERISRQETEVNNKRPGDGITRELYHQILEPLGFELKLYPHNHDLGAEVLDGKISKSSWRMRLSQKLSGMNPDTLETAQSIMCIARRSEY